MTMRVEQRLFYNALKELAHVVKQKARLPILTTVKLEAHDGQLFMAASDLETYVTCHIPAEGELATICLPPKILLELVKPKGRNNAGVVEFESLEKSICAIRVNDISTQLVCIEPLDFPVPSCEKGSEKLDWSLVANVPSEPFQNAIAFVIRAASNDSIRLNLNCVFLNGTWATATDGHRLHRAPLPVSIIMPLLVPTAAMLIICRLYNQSENISIKKAKEFIRFQLGSWQVDTKLIFGQFPNTDNVIREKDLQTTRLIVNTAVFNKALFQIRKISKELQVTFCVNNIITLSVSNAEIGEAKIVVPTLQSSHVGDDLVTHYNPVYLFDALFGAGSSVEMSFAGARDQLRIDISGDFLAVIMPIIV